MAEVSGDPHRRVANDRIGIVEERCDARRHFRPADGIEGRNHRLPDRGVSVTEHAEERFERVAVAEMGQRSGRRKRELRIGQSRDERAGRPAIANIRPERHGGGLPGVGSSARS